MSAPFPSQDKTPPEARARRGHLRRTLAHLLWVALGLQLTGGCLGAKRQPGAPHQPAWLQIDVGRDPAWRLTLLPGIGSRRAYDIVADRRRQGGLEALEDLRRIPGIGPGTLRRLRQAEGFRLWLNGRPLRAAPTPVGEAQVQPTLVR